MGRIRAIFAAGILLMVAFASAQAAQIDSTKLKSMDSLLEECYKAFQYYDIEAKGQLCDIFITDVADPELRQYAAVAMYNHYMSSRLMGDEGVSIHLYDTWFATKKLAMPSEIDFLNAGVYAEFNRRTLLGCEAPVLTLEQSDGTKASIPETGKISVIFIYDTSCSKCKLETMLLSYVLREAAEPFDFYAVYAGEDKQAWEDFRKEKFSFDTGKAVIHHLWDPDMASDFQRAYGVLQTPVMVMVNCEGRIIGRKLNSDALGKLLPSAFLERQLYERCMPGAIVPEFNFNGKLISRPGFFCRLFKKSEPDGTIITEGNFNTLKLKGKPAYLVLHLTNCKDCQAELKAMNETFARKGFEPGTKILLVDVDELVASWSEDDTRKLFDSFDLTTFPCILKLDKKGVILERHCSFISK